MSYRRLPFAQYFINTSEDYNHTGLATQLIQYTALKYVTGLLDKTLGTRHEVNYELHYEPERDVIQLNFQKTVGLVDWIANVLEFSSKYYDAIDFEGAPLQLRVHHGWGNMYRAIKHEIRDSWQDLHTRHPTAETEILGWSLGSGLACLCCQDLNFNFGLKPHVFTYGTVRPFKYVASNRERMERYLSGLFAECWNFADVNDIVTYMPPFRGFTMLRRVEVGNRLRRTLPRLLHPHRYHTTYDREDLYRDLEDRSAPKPQGGTP